MTIWNKAITEISKIIYKGEIQSRLILASMISQGHVLIEDKPGTGKTKLSKIISTISSLETKRIQCTVDMLPTDIIGFEFYDQKECNFTFKKGPIFTNILLADELNRASPKSQSALLQAMEEKIITIQNNSFKLPEPFVVIATQNPQDQHGTFPLPESQLDRFLMRISMGIPSRESEKKVLKGENISPEEICKILSIEELVSIQSSIENLFVSNEIYEYILDLISESRKTKKWGLSTRAALGIIEASKACAFVKGEDAVLPDHVKFIFNAVTEHRLDNGFKQDISLSGGILKEVDAIR